ASRVVTPSWNVWRIQSSCPVNKTSTRKSPSARSAGICKTCSRRSFSAFRRFERPGSTAMSRSSTRNPEYAMLTQEAMRSVKKTILIVEDERVAAHELESSLRGFGYEVLTPASSYDDAIAIAERGKPDLVIMDIHLRGEKDGVEAAALL